MFTDRVIDQKDMPPLDEQITRIWAGVSLEQAKEAKLWHTLRHAIIHVEKIFGELCQVRKEASEAVEEKQGIDEAYQKRKHEIIVWAWAQNPQQRVPFVYS